MTGQLAQPVAALALALLAACDRPTEAVQAEQRAAQAPAVCDEGMVRDIVAEAKRGLDAANQGDIQGYVAATKEIKGRPAACRPVLEQLQPIALRCSETERQVLMNGTAQLMNAASYGNLQGFMAIYDQIEQAVSPACWQAMHRHSHPDVISACRADDLDRLATASPELMRATIVAAATMDPARIAQAQVLALQLMQSIPSPCLVTIQGISKPRSSGPPGGGGGMAGVYDHGNGAYSVPGVAYCGSSGCVPL